MVTFNDILLGAREMLKQSVASLSHELRTPIMTYNGVI